VNNAAEFIQSSLASVRLRQINPYMNLFSDPLLKEMLQLEHNRNTIEEITCRFVTLSQCVKISTVSTSTVGHRRNNVLLCDVVPKWPTVLALTVEILTRPRNPRWLMRFTFFTPQKRRQKTNCSIAAHYFQTSRKISELPA
jgi:hypothetical protein